ncbi:MAG: mycofactocin biosynthesis peptidyl-dipeptidase MftE [Carbonactinosporaceae bacterium]
MSRRRPALGSLTWPETERSAGHPAGVLAVAVGSLEQHGPHLPLDTDARIAGALAAALSRRCRDVVVGPAIPYGASGEHERFPGTISVGQAALGLFVLELIRSASATFPRVVLVNGHGGNAEALHGAAARSRSEGRDVRVWSPRLPGDAHAGRTETSLMLALFPDAVRLDRAEAGVVEPIGALLPRLRRDGVRAVSPSGVLGDPRGATAEEGEALLAAALEDLGTAVERWAS